jgi:hypothetical protein
MSIQACPDCGNRHTQCVDWTERPIEYYCSVCGCYYCSDESYGDRLPIKDCVSETA